MIQPTKWSVPLGSGADVQDLPDDDLKFASFSKIFPQITQVPLSAGGVAPRRIDFNSLFKLLADNIYFYQNGGVFEYSDTADYEKGALVRYDDNIYLCIQDNSALNKHAPTDEEYWLRFALNNEFIADYNNNKNGYIQFSNGLIFAWRTFYEPSSNIWVINKPKPFTTLVAYITDVAGSRTTSLAYQAWVSNESTNTTDTFRSNLSASDSVAIFWIGTV